MLMQSQIIHVALMKMSYHGPVTIFAHGDTNGIRSSVPQFLSSTGIVLNHIPDASPALAAAATNVWQWTILAAGGSPQELAFGANTLCQRCTPTPILNLYRRTNLLITMPVQHQCLC